MSILKVVNQKRNTNHQCDHYYRGEGISMYHLPMCSAGTFSNGLILWNSSVFSFAPIFSRSTGLTTYEISFKFNAIRTRHAHELRQTEYNTGCAEDKTLDAILL